MADEIKKDCPWCLTRGEVGVYPPGEGGEHQLFWEIQCIEEKCPGPLIEATSEQEALDYWNSLPDLWRDISTAPMDPKNGGLGIRGPIIIAINEYGEVHQTFYVPKHCKGDNAWLYGTNEGLVEWFPIKWIPLPDMEFKKRRGSGY